MFPEIDLGIFGKVRLMTIVVVIGTVLMVILVRQAAKQAEKSSPFKERAYIFPKLYISFFGGYLGALIYDALFHTAEREAFEFQGIAFYGGLIGGIVTLYLTMRFMPAYTSFTFLGWLDMLTVPFVVFHFFGRIGCFLSGCCYGRVTDSVFGLHFPDQPEYGLFHNGEKVFPTQLYEALGLLIIIVLLKWVFRKHRLMNYLILYPTLRFFVEFLRADNRGGYILSLSPAQITSLILIMIPIVYYVIKWKGKRKKPSDFRGRCQPQADG